MASAPRLMADAVALGMVTAADVVRGAASVCPMPRSNAVHRIELAGVPVGYVKQAGAASLVDGDDTVRVERAALRRLAGLGFTPAPVAGGRPGTVWTRAARGDELAVSAVHRPDLLDATAAALGARLASWHRLPPPGGGRRAATPWPLLPDLLPSMEAAPQRDELEWVLEATVEPDVVRALGVAGDQWHAADAFVHGDLSRHNVVVDHAAGDEAGSLDHGAHPPTVTFVDVEACGAGHPGWDVVSAVEALTELDPRPGEPAVRAFREAYQAGGGDAHPSPAWTCVRALVSAWQLGLSAAPARSTLVATALDLAVRSAREVA